MPYAGLVAGCCFVGYLVAGFTAANVWLTLGSALLLLLGVIVVLHRRCMAKEARTIGKRETA